MGVGTAVSGMQVLGTREELDDFINRYRHEKKNYHLLSDDQDVCDEVGKLDALYQAEVNDICDRSKGSATQTNVFLGLTIGMAVVSGFFLYKAYLSSRGGHQGGTENKLQDKKNETKRNVGNSWTIVPSTGQHGGGAVLMVRF